MNPVAKEILVEYFELIKLEAAKIYADKKYHTRTQTVFECLAVKYLVEVTKVNWIKAYGLPARRILPSRVEYLTSSHNGEKVYKILKEKMSKILI